MLIKTLLRLILQYSIVFCVWYYVMLSQDLAVITDADFQVLLDELLAYEAVGKLDAIVA